MSRIIDLLDDYFEIIAVIFLISFVVLLCCAQEEGKKICEKEGGVAINNYMGYDCLTKEDLKKIRGEDK